MFTEEQRIYKLLCESEKAQLAEQEIILSLQNVGLSLVNNSSSQEVSFIGITRYLTSKQKHRVWPSHRSSSIIAVVSTV